MNIVVVEDGPTDRQLLRGGGYHVCEKGAADVASIAEPPDVTLLDLKLPGVDALTALRQLERSERTRRIPVIAVTTAFVQFTQRDATTARCEAYTNKLVNALGLSGQLLEATKHSEATR